METGDRAQQTVTGASLRGKALPAWLYALGGALLLVTSPAIAYVLRWGIAKAVVLAAVGVCYVTMAWAMRRARQSRSSRAADALASRARVAANASWLVFIVLWIVERATR